jgi:hypothetical protein
VVSCLSSGFDEDPVTGNNKWLWWLNWRKSSREWWDEVW